MIPRTALALFAVLGAPPGAVAQATDGRPETGLRVGAFVVAPEIAVRTGYESNVFLADTVRTGAAHIVLAPRVTVKSDWNRHALRLQAGGEAGFFSHGPDDNYLDADLALAGEIDITRVARVSARAGFGLDHEARGSDDVPGAGAEPARFAEFSIELRGDFRLGALRLSPLATVRRLDFFDVALTGGGRSNLDDRDRHEVEAGLAAGYRIARGTEAFVAANLLATDYSSPTDDAGLNRDSTGLRFLGGARLRLSGLIEGSLALGYMRRDYADPALGDTAEVAADIALVWSPTRRITGRLDLGRDIRETTVAGAAGVTTGEAELGVSYELLRRLDLRAAAGVSVLEFTGTARTDRIHHLTLGADWRAVRGLSVSPEYRLGLRRSDAPGLDYTAHSFVLGATYRF